MKNMNEYLLDINCSLCESIQNIIPKKAIQKRKPWISSASLALIAERNMYRELNDLAQEKLMSKKIKKQISKDRQRWLDDILEDGNCKAIKDFKHSSKKKQLQANLKDAAGIEIEAGNQAEEMAAPLERNQWYKREGCEGFRRSFLFTEDL